MRRGVLTPGEQRWNRLTQFLRSDYFHFMAGLLWLILNFVGLHFGWLKVRSYWLYGLISALIAFWALRAAVRVVWRKDVKRYQRLLQGDPLAKVVCALGIGRALYVYGSLAGWGGHIQTAIQCLRRAEMLYHNAGNLPGAIQVLSTIAGLPGVPVSLASQSMQKIHYLKKQLEVKGLDRAAERVHNALKSIKEGQYHQAVSRLQRTRRRFLKLRTRNRKGEVVTLAALAYLYEMRAHPLAQYYASEAAKRLKEILTLEKALFASKIQLDPHFFDLMIRSVQSVANMLPLETAWVVWLLLAICYADEGQFEAARAYCEKAIDCVEKARVARTDDERRVQFMTEDKMIAYDFILQLLTYQLTKQRLQEKTDAFNFMPQLLARQEIVERAHQVFHYVERAKARALLDLLELREWRDLKILKREIQQSLPPGFPSVIGILGKEGPPAMRKQMHELLDLLNPESPSKRKEVGVYSAQDIQQTLPPRSAIIEYYLSENLLLAFKVTRDACKLALQRGKPDVQAILQEINQFEKHMLRFVPGLNSGVPARDLTDPVRNTVAALYNRLLGPIRLNWSDIDRLFIIPHGALHRLPFSALFDGERFLIERAAITQVPSGSIWHHLQGSRSHRSGGKESYFGIANPRGDDKRYPAWRENHEFQKIPGCEKIVARIAKFFDPTFNEAVYQESKMYHSTNACILSRRRATYSSFNDCIRNYTVIDIETHAGYDPGLPMRSFFVLTGEEGAPYIVTAEEILRDLQLHPEFQLLVLAVCYGGEVKVTAGDDLLGLIRAFMAAGAQSILAYRWPLIDEPVATEFLDIFYQSWIKGGRAVRPKDQALQEAQIELIRRGRSERKSEREPEQGWPTWDHPYYWAWTLIGDYL